jgi:hypothetical protein
MRAIDYFLDRWTADIGQDRVLKLIDRDDFAEFERLIEKFNYELTSSYDDVKTSVQEMDKLLKELNGILEISNYSIHRKALGEMVKYANKYHNLNALPKTLDTIFQVVNEDRGARLNGKKKMTGTSLYEVRINGVWRLFYDHQERYIVGFDYEHKQPDHSDVLRELTQRKKEPAVFNS